MIKEWWQAVDSIRKVSDPFEDVGEKRNSARRRLCAYTVLYVLSWEEASSSSNNDNYRNSNRSSNRNSSSK